MPTALRGHVFVAWPTRPRKAVGMAPQRLQSQASFDTRRGLRLSEAANAHDQSAFQIALKSIASKDISEDVRGRQPARPGWRSLSFFPESTLLTWQSGSRS